MATWIQAKKTMDLKQQMEMARRDFPILGQLIHGKPLVYLDNAATTQKPFAVIRADTAYYETQNANVHRGVHSLSEVATSLYEDARKTVAEFLNAQSSSEIVFTRSTTESINLVANVMGRSQIGANDEIILTELEHHSNIVPWQLLCERTGARLKIIPILESGDLNLEAAATLFGPHTRMLAMTHVSNALGTVNDLAPLISLAHEHGAAVLIDGAQAVPHMGVDVQALDCDFYVFSGHKIYGPTGIGVLYGKRAWLDRLPPWQGGGDMITSVSFQHTTYADPPHKFEAGTPPIAQAIGLAEAIRYVTGIGYPSIQAYEANLELYALRRLLEIPGIQLIGQPLKRASIISFVMNGIHPHDIGTVLDQYGIAVRAGHHCAMPLMEHYRVPATVRASFAFYNTYEEVDSLALALDKTWSLFHP
ncbi:MAG: cysteine desulfurase [Gammaproteobacteria bacterium]